MKKILDLFSFSLGDKYESEILNKILLINFFSFIYFIFMIITSVLFLIKSNNISAVILFVVSAILVINFFLFRKNQKQEFASAALVVIASISSIYLHFTGGIENSGLFWSLIFPLMSIFLLGQQRGLQVAGIFFAVSLAIFFLPVNASFTPKYELSFKISFSIVYIVIAFLSYTYEFFKIQSNQKLEKSMLDAPKASREKNEFISKLSHQIRTPLNNIQGTIDIINESQLTEEQRNLIDNIAASTNNLETVVASISELSEVKIEVTKNENISFNLHSTVNSTIQLFSNQNADNVNFNFIFANDIPQKLIGNPIKIKQIFLNLIEFLIKNRTKDKLRFDMNIVLKEQKEKTLDCSFEIRTDCMAKIVYDNEKDSPDFAKFTLLDLKITKTLIESSGGKFSIESANNGTICLFSMTFKKDFSTQETKKSEPEAVKPVTPTDEKSIELDNANILLVEDNQINQKIMVLSLKKMVKNIDIANNGKEALEKFATTKYDLILMDVMMPIMDGIKTTMKIRETEFGSNSHIPIIAITANALSGHKEECLAAGMDDYVSKPFQIKVVLEKIKHHLAKAK